MPVPAAAAGGRRGPRPFPHTDEQLNQLNPVGGLVSVNMRNFMCHVNFTQNFYAGVNYITGENGSGKSAVVVALSAALGANCSKIGKGEDLSNLIGLAEPIAVVTVILRNDPTNPRHVSKYKDPVVVERTLVKRSEADRISNRATIKIDGKEARKLDLVELMTAMAIDIGNPAVVLHQDAAKSFGEQNDGKDLYNYFLDATGLRGSADMCENARQSILAERNALSAVKDVRQKLLDGDFAAAKLAMEKCSDLKGLQEKITGLKADCSLLKIHETVVKYDQTSDDLVKYRESKVQVEAQLARVRDELQALQVEDGAEEQQGSSALDAEVTSIEQQHRHLSKKANELKSDRERKLTEKAQADLNIRKFEKQIKEEEKQREEARKEFERQDPNKGRRAAAKLKDEAESLLQKAQDRQRELDGLQGQRGEIEECEHEWRRVQAQFDDIKKRVTEVDEEIRNTQSRRGKTISREEIIRKFTIANFDRSVTPVDLVQVRNAIDAVHKTGVFRGHVPLGPLGMHIALKPEGRQFYQPIALALGQKLLGAFLFDSLEDKETFLRCMTLFPPSHLNVSLHFHRSKQAMAIPNIRTITMW